MDDRQPTPMTVADPTASRAHSALDAEEVTLDALVAGGFRILRRRVKLAVFVLLLFTIPATAYVMSKPLSYQARARILVERSEESRSVLAQPDGLETAVDAIRTQSQLLRARPIVAKAIETVKLWEFPEFQKAGEGMTDASETANLLVEAFLAQLTVWPEQGTRILNLAFEAQDPEVAKTALNTLLDTHIDEQSKTEFAASAEVVGWLNERLEEQRARLEQSEAALQAYVESQNAVSVRDGQNIVVQKLGDLNAAVTRARTERMARETLYTQLRAAEGTPDAVEALPVVLSNAVLQQLRAQLGDLRQRERVLMQDLGDRHPDLIKLRSELELTDGRLRAELAKVAEAVRNEFVAAQTLERELTAALDAQKNEVLDLGRKNIEFGALQRQVTSDREIYDRLLNEVQSREIAGKTPETKIRIVEAAQLPRAPLGPRRSMELLLVLGAGLFLAISVPLAREALDHRIKTPGDIERRLGVRCLALVPIASVKGAAIGPLFSTDPNTFNESFRRLRTVVSMGAPDRQALRLLVTSAAPREGKTMVAVNLAIALAQMNQSVLLVDGDLRRPKVHKMLGISPFPGFADVLSGELEASAAIRHTEVPGLHVLTCGAKHRSASELLSSRQLDFLLDQIQDRFAWILFDSPPTGPVADACILAQRTDCALLVVNADATPATAAQMTLEQLRTAGVPVLGAVLNRADLEGAGYYYAPYYGGDYTDYSPKTSGRKGTSIAGERAPETRSLTAVN
jgi:succinoglycan biosynthesis transport protein ExoP